jgi:hypothetical protein
LIVAFSFSMGAVAFAKEPPPKSTAVLVDTLGQKKSPELQLSAAKKLAEVGDREALDALASALFTYSDPIASACLSALARHHRGKALEVALQCMDAPVQRCSPAMKTNSAKIAPSLWKKLSKSRSAFPDISLSFQLEITAKASLDPKDRWLRHLHAELLEALMADPLVEVGEEIHLFADDTPDSWKPRAGIRLLVRGSIQSIKRHAKPGGNFQYAVRMSALEVRIAALKGKGMRISSISGVARSEDAESLDSRVTRLALEDAAHKIASKIHLWARGKTFSLEIPL